MWQSLINLRCHFNVPWCIGGDWNEIGLGERSGCSRRDKGIRDFNNFDCMEFMDLPMLGRRFTWASSAEDNKWSRIDRFLLHGE